MTPVGELLLVLLIIYLCSCVLWVPRDRVIVAWSPFAGWSLRGARTLWGNDRGGLFLQNPLPIFSAVELSPFPLSISPAGITGRSPETYGTENKAPARFVSFSELSNVTVAGSELHINGSYFVRARSEDAARELKTVIERLQHSSTRREDIIRDFVRRALNFKQAEEQLLTARRSIANLQVFCVVLGVELFVALPMATLRSGPNGLVWLFSALVVTNLITVAMFYKTYRLFCSRKPPCTELAMMLLCFPKTVRACDILTAEVTAQFHPLTFAAAVDKCLLQTTAGRIMAELTFSAEERNAAEQYFRATYTETLQEQLRRVRIQSEQLLAAPDQQDPHSLSYCPLCHSQYRRFGVCTDCIDMPLQPFSQVK